MDHPNRPPDIFRHPNRTPSIIDGTYLNPRQAPTTASVKQEPPTVSPTKCGRVFCDGDMKISMDKERHALFTCEKCGGHVPKRTLNTDFPSKPGAIMGKFFASPPAEEPQPGLSADNAPAA